MDFIPISSPKHVPLSVKERAQLGVLRILGKTGVRLQMQDTIIVRACHYSLVNKPHNGRGDFCIRQCKTQVLSGPVTTLLLIYYTTMEEAFGYDANSQAGSFF